MKAKKVEAFKDSNGNLHADEKSYVLAEHEIWINSLKKLKEELLENDHELYMFYFIKSMAERILEIGKEAFEEELASKLELIKKHKEYKFVNLSESYAMPDGGQEDCPGYWLGICGSDLIQ